MTHLTILALLISLFTLPLHQAYAANTDCKPLYGGGITKEQACASKKAAATPTPKKSNTPLPKPATTTKGGLPVVSPTAQKKTPSTGPEVLGLVALLPAAGLGYYLRKKG